MTIFIDEETGSLKALYDDEKHDFLKQAMPNGTMDCPLASEIKWDNKAQAWAVHTIKFGVLPKRHKHYEDARSYEVKFLEEKF
tara:strand:- start:11254 stop:11502 length:249 start_codon:yes stop_codon:yes gene_type:complete